MKRHWIAAALACLLAGTPAFADTPSPSPAPSAKPKPKATATRRPQAAPAKPKPAGKPTSKPTPKPASKPASKPRAKPAAEAPAAACTDREVGVVKAVPATFPRGFAPVNAEAYVLVELHPDGSIAATSVYRSSSDTALDDAADDAANAGSYRAPAKNCVAYSSSVILRTPFTGGSRTIPAAGPECAESVALLKTLARPADRGSKERGKATGTVVVDVTVSAAGTVSAVELAEKSGNEQLNAEALRIAKASEYYPGRTGCKPVGSSLKLELSFL